MNEICEFEASHSRTGYINIETTICDCCKEELVCICIDSSEDEYGPGCICKRCILKSFEKHTKGEKE